MVKGPKTLNPADRARKEARKKELKKNKKQRLQVRSAVIESKDPEQVIKDLEKLDQLEYDPAADTSSSIVAAFKDKRKKLKEVWEKILVYYQREDQEKHAKLKKLEAEYETKHRRLAKEYEAVKAAQEVKIEDVFLPPDPTDEDIDLDDPLMSPSIYINPLTSGMRPPGCPPGLPPDLKQLAESVKSSLATPIPQPLPQDLLRISRKAMPRAKNNTPRDNRQVQQKQETKPEEPLAKKLESISSGVAPPATKATIIESKPIKFMPTTSKFIPSSVRSKINKKTP